jgi:hypothetical protein
MLSTFKAPIKRAIKDTSLGDWLERRKNDRLIAQWQAAGKPVPPPEIVKRETLAAYADAFHLTTFIETGTFRGDTPYTLRDRFRSIYSIELSPALAAAAAQRFASLPQIKILEGDSGDLLPRLLETISVPCLFWLDGHYSGGVTAQGRLDTPILKELDTVFSHRMDGHVVLIDDARLFNGTQDYPTLEELRKKFQQIAPAYEFSVVHDIIRAHPAKDVPSPF